MIERPEVSKPLLLWEMRRFVRSAARCCVHESRGGMRGSLAANSDFPFEPPSTASSCRSLTAQLSDKGGAAAGAA